MRSIYVDIDGVITCPPEHDGAFDYTEASPDPENIRRINRLYDAGHRVTYYTARGTVTGEDWRAVTEAQLERWGCRFHALRMGKPAFDVLIDDRAWNVDRLSEVTNRLTDTDDVYS